MPRIFDRDPLTGITRYFHPGEREDDFAIETVMDVEPILEDNKTLLNAESSKGRKWGELDRVAEIPLHIYFDLLEKGITRDQKKMRAWLNDPENRYFRVKGGRV